VARKPISFRRSLLTNLAVIDSVPGVAILAIVAVGLLVEPVTAGERSATGKRRVERRLEEGGAEARDYFERWLGERGTPEDDPRPELADEFLGYYREHPDREIGYRALRFAFMMLGNLRAVDEIEALLPEIPADSPAWSWILNDINHAYVSRWDEFERLCEKLSGRLTDSFGRSELLMILVDFAPRDEDLRLPRDLLEEVVALDASEHYVLRARGELREIDHLAPGQPAPRFRAKDLDGNVIDLEKLRGHVVVLEFWATWCGPCLSEIPHFRELYASHRDDGLVVIGISHDTRRKELRSYVAENGIGWPQIIQPRQHLDEIPQLYNAWGIPRTFVIDRDGTIAAKDLRGVEPVDRVTGLVSPRANPKP